MEGMMQLPSRTLQDKQTELAVDGQAILHQVIDGLFDYPTTISFRTNQRNHTILLVGGWFTPLKKIRLRQLRDDEIPNISGKMPNSWQPVTTNQII